MSRTKSTKAVLAAETNQVIGRWRVDSVVEGSTRQVKVTCLSCDTQSVRCIYDLTRARRTKGQQCQRCANKQTIANNKLPPGEALISGEYGSYRKAARLRGHEWLLSREEFSRLIRGHCYYCAAAPSRRVESIWDSLVINGIDRIDNTLGYTTENCVTCCKICNYAKGKLTQEEFLDMCERVTERWR
jgi:hypothetical protein